MSRTIIIPLDAPTSTCVLNRSPKFLEERNKTIVKMYRKGHPLRVLAEQFKLSERRLRGIISESAVSSEQRQHWYDQHEENARRFRSARQVSQNRFKPK